MNALLEMKKTQGAEFPLFFRTLREFFGLLTRIPKKKSAKVMIL